MSAKINAGAKILDGLRDALSGNFSSVTIEGQTWVRQAWQPIETAPRDGTVEFLGYWPGDFVYPGSIEETEVGGRKWMPAEFIAGDSWSLPTHWMPLPSPPSNGGRAEK